MKKEKNKVVIVVGTRPEAIKLVPLYLVLKNNDHFDPILVSTGQHKEMLKQVFDFFDVKPDHDLGLMFANQTLSGITSLLFTNLQKMVDDLAPALIVVQGDTQSAMVGGLVGFYNRVKIAHVEAGLRTYDKYSPFPEEVNRQTIGLIADYNFCPTERAANNLRKENKKGVYVVGNTVIDALLLCLKKVEDKSAEYLTKFAYTKDFERIVVITGHRRENFSGGLQRMAEAIKELAQNNKNTCFIYPVHLNPKVQEVIQSSLKGITNVKLIDPLGYDELVFLMSKCFAIITDSGGIQEEAPSLNVPVLVTRDTTERPEGVDEGCSILVGTDQERIIGEFNRLLSDKEHYQKMASANNPYGNGSSSKEIVEILLKDLV